MKLEKLPKENIDELADKFSLKIFKSSDDMYTDIYEVHSKKRLGVTEFETAIEFAEGINALVEAENSL